MRNIYRKVQNGARVVLKFISQNRRDFVYYGCIFLVLCMAAYGAEVYRNKNETNELILAAGEASSNVPQAGETPQFIVPDNANLIRQYSAEPQWNDNLGLWECRPGEDYMVDGGAVKTFAAGKVSKIAYDYHRGNYVEVTGDDFILRYCSVSADENIEQGCSLASGDLIGIVDRSMPGEAGQEGYMHLQAENSGEFIAPELLNMRKTNGRP